MWCEHWQEVEVTPCWLIVCPTDSTEGWEPIPELLETFRTEFALRLLWGHQGAVAEKKERYKKFDKILCVLSNKLEPEDITPKLDPSTWICFTKWTLIRGKTFDIRLKETLQIFSAFI